MKYIFLNFWWVITLTASSQSLTNLDYLNGFWSFKLSTPPSANILNIEKSEDQGTIPYLSYYNAKSPKAYNINGVTPFSVCLVYYKNQLQEIQIMFSLNKGLIRTAKELYTETELDKLIFELNKLFGVPTEHFEKNKNMSVINTIKWTGAKVSCYLETVEYGLLDTDEYKACWIVFEDNKLTNQKNLEKYK